MLSIINPSGYCDLTVGRSDWTSAPAGAPCQQQPHTTPYTPDCSNVNLDNHLLDSFKHLLSLYKTYTRGMEGLDGFLDLSGDGGTASPMIIAGGLQQYLIKNMKLHKQSVQQPRKGAGSEYTTFHDFPDSIGLTIFAYLDVRDLCVAAMVCRHWYCLTSDEILWRNKLERDVAVWDVISHRTNPDTYKECQSDWTAKELYLRCSPEVGQFMRDSNRSFHHLSSALRAIWPKKKPRVVMFGPGMETGGGNLIVRHMLEDRNSMYQTLGMFPGQFEGIGSGFKMKAGNVNFDLITLYTSSRREREGQGQGQRLLNSRLIAHNRPAQEQEGEQREEIYEVRQAIKDLCRTLDAFIFVVDSSQGDAAVCEARLEMHAMVRDEWVGVGVPVVVVSCVPDPTYTRLSAHTVTRKLRLNTLNRPWLVRDCVASTMDGVLPSITWLVEQAQRT